MVQMLLPFLVVVPGLIWMILEDDLELSWMILDDLEQFLILDDLELSWMILDDDLEQFLILDESVDDFALLLYYHLLNY